MDEKIFLELIKNTNRLQQEDYMATKASQRKITAKMIDAAHHEKDKLEHHLLTMPLSVIIYQWVILRLKSRPWRLLIPTSVILSILLQGLLSRINLFQLLTH